MFFLTGFHLRDIAAVQNDAAHQLNEIRIFADHPLGRFAHNRERFRQ